MSRKAVTESIHNISQVNDKGNPSSMYLAKYTKYSLPDVPRKFPTGEEKGPARELYTSHQQAQESFRQVGFVFYFTADLKLSSRTVCEMF